MILSIRYLFFLAVLLLSAAQGTRAQTVSTEEELRTAVQTNNAGINLSEELVFDGKGPITLDRDLSTPTSYGNVLRVNGACTLTVKDSSDKSVILVRLDTQLYLED